MKVHNIVPSINRTGNNRDRAVVESFFTGRKIGYHGNGLEIWVSKTHLHDNLAVGQPVSYAGTIVLQNGNLIERSNHSGHYQPLAIYRDQAPREFSADLFAVVTNDDTLASFNPNSPNHLG